MSTQKCVIVDGREAMAQYNQKLHVLLRNFPAFKKKDDAKLKNLLRVIKDTTDFEIKRDKTFKKKLQDGVCIFVGTSEECLELQKKAQPDIVDAGGNLIVDDVENHIGETRAYKELMKELAEKRAEEEAAANETVQPEN